MPVSNTATVTFFPVAVVPLLPTTNGLIASRCHKSAGVNSPYPRKLKVSLLAGRINSIGRSRNTSASPAKF